MTQTIFRTTDSLLWKSMSKTIEGLPQERMIETPGWRSSNGNDNGLGMADYKGIFIQMDFNTATMVVTL